MSSTIAVIANELRIDEITYAPEFSAFCRIGKQSFHGTLEICYQPGAWLLEFESFETWLKSIASMEVTIEEFARHIFDVLRERLGDIPLRITVYAETTVHAPVSVTIKE